jgi:hypothetical protein
VLLLLLLLLLPPGAAAWRCLLVLPAAAAGGVWGCWGTFSACDTAPARRQSRVIPRGGE